jgi:hypothetical protein
LANLLIALIILLLAAGIYVALLIKNLQSQIKRLSYHLYFETTRKADLIPQFLDKTGQVFPAGRLKEIIDSRALSLKTESFGKEKKNQEEQLWRLFAQLLQEIHNRPELKSNLTLLALEKDLIEAEKRVAENQQTYNQTVNKYNKIVGNLFLKPVSILVKASRLETF